MEKFKVITHNNNNPFFNIASEEYLLKQKSDYYIYLWINAPAVIVGVNQNAFEEVNLNYAEMNDIKIVRRLTGGGAVYHDLNNICYSVIAPYNNQINGYKEFSSPIIQYLKSFNIDAEFSGRNDILIDGKKVSGNAQTVYNNRILHHGTLLFDVDIEALSNVLNPSKIKIESKGIKSVKSRVINIKDYMNKGLSSQDFKNSLYSFYKRDCEEYTFSDSDIKEIDKLIKNKYSTYEWNFGNSPRGSNTISRHFDFGNITFTFDTVNGKVENPVIRGDFFSLKPIEELTKRFCGIKIQKEEIEKILGDISSFIVGAKEEDIIKEFFN